MNPASPIRVLVVDDHPVVRTGLRAIPEVDPGIVIVGEAGTAAEALASAALLRPDLVLLDVRLPDRSGLEVCRELKALPEGPQVLFLTSFADNALVLAAMEAGGDGYLLKDKLPREIASAISAVFAHGSIFEPVVSRAVDRELRSALPVSATPPATPPARVADPLATLSDQERRVLEGLADGRTDKEIAASLGLQPKTVRNYLERVFEKLAVNTRTQAALIYDRSRR